MSHRLQVLIPEDLHRRIAKAAQRERISQGELVRRAIESALRAPAHPAESGDPLARLGALDAPTGEIEEILEQIDAGRA